MLVALWARLLSLLYRWSFAEVIAAFISATSQCESMQVKDAAVEGLCYDVFPKTMFAWHMSYLRFPLAQV